jgi:hypothetical protein
MRINWNKHEHISKEGNAMSKSPKPSTDAGPSSSLFGPPPLLEGEDPSAYNGLLVRISGAVKPADVFEEIWVWDIVNLTWETFRWRRLTASLIRASTHLGVKVTLAPTQKKLGEINLLAEDWAAGDPDVIKEVKKRLASAGLSMDAVMAHTFAAKITEIERIDRLTMNAELRRNAALREIERHRASFGQALRRASNEQFEQVEAPQIEGRDAA